MPLIEVVHDEDPRDRLLRKAGDLSDLEVFNSYVLVGVYMRPKTFKLAGKDFFMTDKARDEDRYQSKTGLILKMGKKAFQDPREEWFEGDTFSVGDWVIFKTSDSWEVTLPIQKGPADDTDVDNRGFRCRLMEDLTVKMRVPHPDYIY